MSTLLIRGGRIIDPSQNLDKVGDLVLKDGVVAGIDVQGVQPDEVIDADGLLVVPGLVDCQVALREPGFEEAETIQTGTAAALAGGVTSVACLPDTSPVVDNRAAAEFIQLQSARAGHCHVFPLGAVTKGHKGEELAEIGQLVEGGAVGFTEGKQAVANAEVLRRALQYTRMFDRPILCHPQVPELVQDGVMHEGFHSTLLGLRGMPTAAEEVMTMRDIALAELTNGRIHLMCLSTAGSVDLVRRAKQRGIPITASVAVHNLLLTDEALKTFDPNYKVNPPLRTQRHVDALVEGLKDGTIDVVTADHQPWPEELKDREITLAPFGISGLETLLSLAARALIEPGFLTWPQLIEKLAVAPAKVLGLNKGTLQVGADADVTLIHPNLEWEIDPQQFYSKSRNTPFAGWKVTARVTHVFVGGRLRYTLEQGILESADKNAV